MTTYKEALRHLKRIQFGIVVKESEDYHRVIRCKGDLDIEKISEEITLKGSIVAVKSGSQLYVLEDGGGRGGKQQQ